MCMGMFKSELFINNWGCTSINVVLYIRTKKILKFFKVLQQNLWN